MNKEKLEKIKKLKKQGYSLEKIAQKLGFKSQNTIVYWLRKMEIEKMPDLTFGNKMMSRIVILESENSKLKRKFQQLKEFFEQKECPDCGYNCNCPKGFGSN